MSAVPSRRRPGPPSSGPAGASPVPHTPVWFMRQAGRSLPEYRAVRADVPMLEACRDPDLVTEITLQPVRRHGVDAAILFSDIVVPLAAAGVDLEIRPGVGPVVAKPVRHAGRRRRRCRRWTPGEVDFVDRGGPPAGPRARGDAADRLRRRAVHARLVPHRGRPVAHPRPDQGADARRARRLARAVRPAGRRSRWSSCGCRPGPASARCSCSTRGPARCPRPTTAGSCCRTRPRVLGALAAEFPDLPRIHFGVGTGELLAGDGRGRRERGRRRLAYAAGRGHAPGSGPAYAVQGNLDPALLLAPWPVVEAEVRRDRCARARPRPGTCSTSATACCPRPTPTC